MPKKDMLEKTKIIYVSKRDIKKFGRLDTPEVQKKISRLTKSEGGVVKPINIEFRLKP